MTRILVTGGAGFLGQYLVGQLVRAGHEVTVLDLRPSRHALIDIEKVCRRLCYGIDVTQPEDLRGHFERMDVVYHLAGLVSFWSKDRHAMYRTNVLGTREVLREAARAGVPRFVHVSSVAAVGYTDDRDRPADEGLRFDWSRVKRKYYMLSKHLAEQEVWAACRAGMNAVVASPGALWGPGDLHNSGKLIAGIFHKGVPAYPAGGTNLVDVRDVARGLVSLLDRGRRGERYILGGENLLFREVFKVIAEILGVAAPTRPIPRWLGPLLSWAAAAREALARTPPRLTADLVDSSCRFRYFSSARAERELGWKLRYSYPETVHDSVEWLRAHGRLLP